jgi:hypothetical protein
MNVVARGSVRVTTVMATVTVTVMATGTRMVAVTATVAAATDVTR